MTDTQEKWVELSKAESRNNLGQLEYSLESLLSIPEIKRAIEEAKREERDRIKRDLDIWCESQAKRWENSPRYAEDRFIGGVISAYRWMADHLPHLVVVIDRRCPRSTLSNDGLISKEEGK